MIPKINYCKCVAMCLVAVMSLTLAACGRNHAVNDRGQVISAPLGQPEGGPVAPKADAAVDQAIKGNNANSAKLETAVVAGGCFWCSEAVFQHVKGVTNVIAGYSGGKASTANYDTVSTGTTKHHESIKITFDPKQVSFAQLLRVFFSVVHPTQADGQGPDIGPQYQLVIFYMNDQQKQATQRYIKQLQASGLWDAPLAIQLIKFTAFYPAEGYHQDYVKKHPDDGYVVQEALPKLEKLREDLPSLWRDRWGSGK